MANLKEIAATLALLGSGPLLLTGCDKEAPATEVPASADAAAPADADGGEGSCGGEGGEGSCGGDHEKGEGSCGEGHEKGEGSCGG